jgi:hypothetical protein
MGINVEDTKMEGQDTYAFFQSFPLMKRLLCRQFGIFIFIFIFKLNLQFLHYLVWSAELLIRPLNANFFIREDQFMRRMKEMLQTLNHIYLFNDQQKKLD